MSAEVKQPAAAAPAPAASQVSQVSQVPQVVVSYVWAYVVVGIIVVVVAGGFLYHKRSGFLVGQPRSDYQHDWSMANEVKKLEERQRMLLAKMGK